MQSIIILFFLSFCFFFTIHPSHAAGLLGVCSDSNYSTESCPKLFFPSYTINNGSANVKYRIDQGTLGDFSNNTLESSVHETLGKWEDVSSVKFNPDGTGFLDFDVDSSNYNSILLSDNPLGYSPIIFDHTGEILQDVFGTGSEQDILGFASARFFNVKNNQITGIAESQALFNGYLYTLANRSSIPNLTELLQEFKATILHEFAHMVGLDHSQGGQITEYDENSSALQLETFPIMFPINVNPSLTLQKDDIASINIAYPKNQIVSNTGKIKGKVINGNEPVYGANVIAYNINNPLVEMVTSVSDVDGLGKGNFVLPNLTPGSYVIKVEPIYSSFTAGSSVGLHNPPNDPSTIPPSFYNGGENLLQDLSLNTALNRAYLVEVKPSSTVENIEINFGSSNTANFELTGKAINNAIFLANKKKSINLRFNKIGSGKRYINLSTDYADLISFSENPVLIRSNESTKVIKVNYSSYSKFLERLGDEFSGTFSIPIRAEDLFSGDLVDTKTLRVF